MNCKPGDLAIITHARGSSVGTGANVGRICKVVRAEGNKTMSAGDTLFCWWIEMVGSPGTDASLRRTQDGWFPDAYLKPITPPAVKVEQREEATA